MSVPSATSRVDYTGNSTTPIYPYTFRIFLDTDLLVTVNKTSTGAQTTLVKTTDYTVSNVGALTGGNVTLVNSGQVWLDASGNLATGYTMTVRRVRPITQTTDIRNQGDFFPETHEDAFDHGIMVAQQLYDNVSRAIQLPESVPASVFSPILPSNIASYVGLALIVNDAGTGIGIGSGGGFDVTRIFNSGTYVAMKALAAASPTLPRFAWISDYKVFGYYTADITVGDVGWINVPFSFIGG